MTDEGGFRRASCSRKVAFTRLDRAERSAGKYGLNVYQCLYGPHWHIGHDAKHPERVAEAEAEAGVRIKAQHRDDRERWLQKWSGKYVA